MDDQTLKLFAKMGEVFWLKTDCRTKIEPTTEQSPNFNVNEDTDFKS